ncbi:hypothetical protein [Ottowia thiooxydans]
MSRSCEGLKRDSNWMAELDQGLIFQSSPASPQVSAPSDVFACELVRSNIGESFKLVEKLTPHAKSIRNWFHSFAGTLSLLGSRAFNKEEFRQDSNRYEKLLKSELMRGQLQATYRSGDADRLDRSRSPLVREGYSRAVRTGLWMAAADMRTEQLRDALKEKAQQLDDFLVFPVSRAVEYKGMTLTRLSGVDNLHLSGLHSVYIESLRVQLILKTSVTLDEMDGHLGRQGLRASPSECAEICAQSLVRKISEGDILGALKSLNNAFHGESATAVQRGLFETHLAPNTLMVLEESDPLVGSSLEQLKWLRQAYENCLNAGTEGLPFFLVQNIQVISHLMGDIEEFAKPSLPATICGDLTDTLEDAAHLIFKAGIMAGAQSQPQAWSLLMEHFYQAMQDIHRVILFQQDWAGRGPGLRSSVESLLLSAPAGGTAGLSMDDAQALSKLLTVERAPHALAMLEQIYASLPGQNSVAYLAGGYYETPGLFKDPVCFDWVTDPGLIEKDFVVLEPHPNNAAQFSVHAHDPVALIHHLFPRELKSGFDGPRQCTVVMDVTLSHLGESQIRETLLAAKPHIESGRLNLIFLQSGTKFVQNGMDLVNIGYAAIFNQQPYWADFQASMVDKRMYVPKGDEGYIARMLSGKNLQYSLAYLEKVRRNTALLRTLLEAEIAWGHGRKNAYEICVNTDEKTVYVSFRLTDAYLAKTLRKTEAEVSSQERAALNAELYEAKFLPVFEDLSAVDRSSFGFNITNFGECGETVRITLGIEEPSLLKEYAKRIIHAGATIYSGLEEI